MKHVGCDLGSLTLQCLRKLPTDDVLNYFVEYMLEYSFPAGTPLPLLLPIMAWFASTWLFSHDIKSFFGIVLDATIYTTSFHYFALTIVYSLNLIRTPVIDGTKVGCVDRPLNMVLRGDFNKVVV